ncbi:uncharacterized protein vlc [Fopius arisanus]|uniref:Uncharacterized protein vlc n=1 Tax=Fopius arisanus TaxID=64838 RepID=A0A9R1T1N9_9HYME|nr:PREDICTED: uncharacterized protein LOC105265330 [Fopius arisanus]XP_011301072.1 PREDICTED: uncharacterized protein LOC105265330 [Fopius arisanus]
MANRPKIEIVRVSSVERRNFRPLDGIQLRATYSHVRIGTYCPEPEMDLTPCENKPPNQGRKFKKNLGPVSRLLRRRHQGTCLATKSCDNIYNVNRNNGSLDWHSSQSPTNADLDPRQSNSLDWRIGRRINSDWQDISCSAEHLNSRNTNISVFGLRTPSAKSKIVSLLRRLSPRLPRPNSKNLLPSSSTVCPWIRVEYSTESMSDWRRETSQETDVSFQHELQLNDLRKRIATASPSSSQSQAIITEAVSNGRLDINENTEKNVITVEIVRGDQQSVHEDRKRGVDNRRPRPKSGTCHSEVAGLEEDNGSDTTVTAVPGGGGSGSSGRSSNRRNRPLSLAVQPLNYQHLDPDTISRGGIKHPNMTSQESIGSCSLDVDRSASDRSEATVDSISERTLHSLNLSNGDTASPTDNPVNGSNETISKTKEKTPEKDNLNGEIETEQLTAKKPSYLGLACSISGYSGITRYDSKLREGFRSRDSSPGSRLITRETSPAGFRSSENLGIPAKSQSISPLAMDRQNGFSNGNKECRVATFVETRSSLGTCQGYSEVDRGLPIHSFTDISPIRGSPKRMTQITTCRETKTFTSTITVSSPKTSNTSNLPSNCLNESNLTNGSAIETDNQALNSSCEKSFIQQRVERLYGPGALAQGFFFKRSLNQSTSSESSFNKSSNNNDSLIDNANTEESLKNLPVLRHLRPEFRAQLPVVSPRRATDGSEQVKPLQRISPVVGKNDGKTTVSPPSIKISDHEAFKLSSSVTSIPDQQPAALEVVLPVLEPSVSATSVPEALKSMQESQTEEKDGHYFMKLLKAEIDRLFKLAVSAEEVLESGEQLPEEAAGKLRSAAGKARLLATQKMQQFEGLCHKNINQIPGEEFPTTNEDLAGFWDMVMLQVVQVNDLFEHIDKLKRSQWQEIPPEKSAATQGQNGVSAKRRTVVSQKPKSAANSEANRKAREAREVARRQMMEERRKAMKSQIQQSVEIFAPKT